MLDSLNDDCLLEIIEHLSLKDEIASVEVCPRMRSLIGSKWAIRYVTLRLPTICDVNALSSPELRVLLKNICGVVRRVFLLVFGSGHWIPMLFGEFKFPETEELELLGDLSDDEMLAMSAAFPNVRTLRLSGYFTGIHIARFMEVEDLILNSHDVNGLLMQHFSEILQMLPSKKLRIAISEINRGEEDQLSAETMRCLRKIEALSIPNEMFLWMMQDTDPFENLKQLTFKQECNLDRIFEWVRKFKRNELSEIKIVGRPAHNQLLQYLPLDFYDYLKELTFYAADVSPLFLVTTALNDGTLLNLRAVFFWNCVLRSASEILHFLKSSRHIELVSFASCRAQFRKLDILIPDLVHAERTRPLTVNFYDRFVNRPHRLQVAVIGASDMLKVTNEKIMHSSDQLQLVFN